MRQKLVLSYQSVKYFVVQSLDLMRLGICILRFFPRIMLDMTPDNNDMLDDIPSIVPERDELVSHRKRNRGTAASAGSASHMQEVLVSRTSGPVVFLLSILFLGMLASAAAGYYFYIQGEASREEAINASARIAQLENHLSLVDQAAEQSSMDLVERVNFNFAEIDKLWAARNTLKTEVEGMKTSLTQVQGTTKSLETTVSSHSKTLTENVTAMEARLDQINKNFAGMDDLGQQLLVLNADLNRVKTTMTTLDGSVTSRLAAYEQDIESINVYRLQLNQTIATLQESINKLQQRLGQNP
jgi:hypothetical protein